MRHGAWILCLATFMFVGCSSARMISTDANGGCVAVADNSDVWPSYNITKAHDLIKKQCPGEYVIVKQEEVVVGQTTTRNTERNKKEVPLVKGLVLDVQENQRDTTTVSDRTEWRIWYQRKGQ